jgi:hypothetical protein
MHDHLLGDYLPS